MSFKLTRLLSGQVVSDKETGKGKVHMHVGGAAQGKCQIGGPVLQTNELESSTLTGSW